MLPRIAGILAKETYVIVNGDVLIESGLEVNGLHGLPQLASVLVQLPESTDSILRSGMNQISAFKM